MRARTGISLAEALRANTKRRSREIARCAIEGARTSSGLMPAASSAAIRAPSPFGFSRPRRHERAPAVRHENCTLVRRSTKRLAPRPRNMSDADGLHQSGCGSCDRACPTRRDGGTENGFERNREAFSCPRRKACQVFVSAPRAAFVPVGASKPEGLPARGRQRPGRMAWVLCRTRTGNRRNADDAPTVSWSAAQPHRIEQIK